LKGKNYKSTSYLIIAGKLNLDQLDYKELVRFMKAGNHVFIATEQPGDVLEERLKLSINHYIILGKSKKYALSFVNPSLNPLHKYYLDQRLAKQYFTTVDTSRAKALGKGEDGDTNFVKYSFGAGALYIMANPQVFTNYNLLSTEGAQYAAKALSVLPLSKTLIIDEYSTRNTITDNSIFRVVFAHPPLAWAYSIALSGLLLFVIFEMKRRQRIIPVIEPLTNSSVEFVKVVGRVYYQQRDNRDITEKKISYFLEYIRTRYNLKTNIPDDELAAALILKSGVTEETITGIFDSMQKVAGGLKVSDQQLIHLNTLIEKFYNQVQ